MISSIDKAPGTGSDLGDLIHRREEIAVMIILIPQHQSPTRIGSSDIIDPFKCLPKPSHDEVSVWSSPMMNPRCNNHSSMIAATGLGCTSQFGGRMVIATSLFRPKSRILTVAPFKRRWIWMSFLRACAQLKQIIALTLRCHPVAIIRIAKPKFHEAHVFIDSRYPGLSVEAKTRAKVPAYT